MRTTIATIRSVIGEGRPYEFPTGIPLKSRPMAIRPRMREWSDQWKPSPPVRHRNVPAAIYGVIVVNGTIEIMNVLEEWQVVGEGDEEVLSALRQYFLFFPNYTEPRSLFDYQKAIENR